MSHCDKCGECREGGCETCCYCMADLSLARVPTSREEAFLAAVMAEVVRARAKHPTPSLAALVEEVGEYAKGEQEGHSQDLQYSELVQVACVALRLAIEHGGR